MSRKKLQRENEMRKETNEGEKLMRDRGRLKQKSNWSREGMHENLERAKMLEYEDVNGRFLRARGKTRDREQQRERERSPKVKL